jgi:hypothetical protein
MFWYVVIDRLGNQNIDQFLKFALNIILIKSKLLIHDRHCFP